MLSKLYDLGKVFSFHGFGRGTHTISLMKLCAYLKHQGGMLRRKFEYVRQVFTEGWVLNLRDTHHVC
jgi:hypothetical protein